jgi:hypothetical protein
MLPFVAFFSTRSKGIVPTQGKKFEFKAGESCSFSVQCKEAGRRFGYHGTSLETVGHTPGSVLVKQGSFFL